jgi:hypothetical protein
VVAVVVITMPGHTVVAVVKASVADKHSMTAQHVM